MTSSSLAQSLCPRKVPVVAIAVQLLCVVFFRNNPIHEITLKELCNFIPTILFAIGWRIGKGEGYADLEYAMMASMNAVKPDTVVVTTVHDCQVCFDFIACFLLLHSSCLKTVYLRRYFLPNFRRCLTSFLTICLVRMMSQLTSLLHQPESSSVIHVYRSHVASFGPFSPEKSFDQCQF